MSEAAEIWTADKGPPQNFTRTLADLIGSGHPLLKYRRPESVRDMLDSPTMGNRWDEWTGDLSPADSIFHEIPYGEEDEFCAALDWLRRDYLYHVHRRNFPQPSLHALAHLPAKERHRIGDEAQALRLRWKSWRGTPWHVVRHARAMAGTTHHVDFYRRCAGKR